MTARSKPRRRPLPANFAEGTSRRCPFDAGDTYRQRHERRLQYAVEHEEEARAAVEAIDGWLRITNEGHHWTFRCPGAPEVEWWPSTGRCVVAKRFAQATHCHDFEQVLDVIRKVTLKGSRPVAEREATDPNARAD